MERVGNYLREIVCGFIRISRADREASRNLRPAEAATGGSCDRRKLRSTQAPNVSQNSTFALFLAGEKSAKNEFGSKAIWKVKSLDSLRLDACGKVTSMLARGSRSQCLYYPFFSTYFKKTVYYHL